MVKGMNHLLVPGEPYGSIDACSPFSGSLGAPILRAMRNQRSLILTQTRSGDKLLLGNQRRLGSGLTKMARLEGSPSF